MKRCLCLMFCALSLVSCFETSEAEAPKRFQQRVSREQVPDSIFDWARATAKSDGLRELKSKFPDLKVERGSPWINSPKEIHFAAASTTELAQWFFYFHGEDNYYIRMIVDADKQASLDVGRDLQP
jgi:hypothetical protein